MQIEALKILNTIEQFGFKAYIVGGFVRDKFLGIESLDVDICTNATPKDLKNIFCKVHLKQEMYGSVTVKEKKIRFEITTFRKDIGYKDHRTPKKVKYINNLSDDLKRRDFTINTLCMDANENIIDLLNGMEDIENKIIRMVGNPRIRLKEDSLRILRAIRFATVLDFTLDKDLKKYIKKYGHLLKSLSYNRKKEELDKIFSSKNNIKGIELIKELNLEKYLNINLTNLVVTSSILGIWAQIDDFNYNYSNNEKEIIKNIKKYLKEDINNYNLYHYDLYISYIVAEIKGISKKEITTAYDKLPIKSSKDIQIKGNEIMNILNKKGGPYLKEIFIDIENKILNNTLINNSQEITNYILKNYK